MRLVNIQLIIFMIFFAFFPYKGHPDVTVFVIDSTAFTDREREEFIYDAFTHGRMVAEIIQKNSKPDNIFLIDVSKIEEEYDEKTGDLIESMKIGYHETLTALNAISKYADQHPDEKIVVNMSYYYYRPLEIELLSRNDKIVKMAKEDLAMSAMGMHYNQMTNLLFSLLNIGFLSAKYSEGEIDNNQLLGSWKEDYLLEELHRKGVITVACAGNDHMNARAYPAAHPDVIAVAGHSKSYKRSEYSNHGTHIDFATSGVIKKRFASRQYSDDATSFATPRVTALIVQMLKLARHKEIDPRKIIKETATPLKDEDYKKGLVGAGAINPLKALRTVDPDYKVKVTMWDKIMAYLSVASIGIMVLVSLITLSYLAWFRFFKVKRVIAKCKKLLNRVIEMIQDSSREK